MLSALDDAAGRGARRSSGTRGWRRIRCSSSSATTAARRCPGRRSTARGTPRSGARSGPRSKGASASRSSLSWKGKLPAGKVYDRPVIQLDILPTALAAAGVAGEAPDAKPRRGRPPPVPRRPGRLDPPRQALLAARRPGGDPPGGLEARPLRQHPGQLLGSRSVGANPPPEPVPPLQPRGGRRRGPRPQWRQPGQGQGTPRGLGGLEPAARQAALGARRCRRRCRRQVGDKRSLPRRLKQSG